MRHAGSNPCYHHRWAGQTAPFLQPNSGGGVITQAVRVPLIVKQLLYPTVARFSHNEPNVFPVKLRLGHQAHAERVAAIRTRMKTANHGNAFCKRVHRFA